MPPSSLTFLKYAPITLPIVPYAEAGPLYGLVLPILISVAVTPGVSAAVAGTTRASTATSALSTVLLNMMSSCSAPAGPPDRDQSYSGATLRHARRFRGARRGRPRDGARRRCR